MLSRKVTKDHKSHAQAENDQANIQYELWVVGMRHQPLEQLLVVQTLMVHEVHWEECKYDQWIKFWYLDLDEGSYKADVANSSCTCCQKKTQIQLTWKKNVWYVMIVTFKPLVNQGSQAWCLKSWKDKFFPEKGVCFNKFF